MHAMLYECRRMSLARGQVSDGACHVGPAMVELAEAALLLALYIMFIILCFLYFLLRVVSSCFIAIIVIMELLKFVAPTTEHPDATVSNLLLGRSSLFLVLFVLSASLS